MQVNIPISHLNMILNRIPIYILQLCKKTSHPKLMALFTVNLYLVDMD